MKVIGYIAVWLVVFFADYIALIAPVVTPHVDLPNSFTWAASFDASIVAFAAVAIIGAFTGDLDVS